MPLIAAEPQPPRTIARSSTRNDALDWTKGSLIICMVIYHAINYSAFHPWAHRFLAFLPPSFIFITGFLVGQIYAAKYDLKSWKPYARLAVRGTKLLLIFTALNLGRCVFAEHSLEDGIWEFAERSQALFLSGNGRAGIFEVLLPIAYFLLLAPALLWLRCRANASTTICAAAVFLLCLSLNIIDHPLKNLDLLSAGVIGMAFGWIPIGTIDHFANKWMPVLLLYLLYRLCSFFLDDSYAVQTLGAVMSVLLLYCFASHLKTGTWLDRQMVTFGRYSLFGYLAQVAMLQAVVKMCGGKSDHWLGVVTVTAVTTLVLFCVVQAVNALRQKSRVTDVIYKSVFA